MMRIGSLFSGYGGLDLGVQSVLGGDVMWHAEIDKAPAAILAHHYPHVPNLGDVTAVEWATVPPIDVLTGGFPCQDVSTAGLRRGLKDGTRSGLWTVMAQAVDAMRPSLVVIENVRGLLSAEASSDMEPCPWCVGDGGGEPPLRALGAVLGDLAELGYDARWTSVRASDVGACHRRERVFIVAYPADTDGAGSETRRHTGHEGKQFRVQPVGPAVATADIGSGSFARNPISINGLPVATECRRSIATDASGKRYGRRQDVGLVGRVECAAEGSGRQASTAREVASNRGHEDAADADGERGFVSSTGGQPAVEVASGDGNPRRNIDWGQYEPAIRRWEQQLGRPAPAPTEPGKNQQPRLSPRFVEWMMGLPDGHVTSPAIGISRNHQLKALGNGVVPQQAAHALRSLLGITT